ncbi:uncharacterized protein LOC133714044 isoform X2 [Rosa rugosa]|uniref:uncharacterized protein LOC133714044 isoform X2 n=1 Tax=Rosa rugosa TaxID=74645 RepID=UPI002B40432E|nr:uncharacterized protein LOC133714044 isoform X2 [Rosa rugosa]
MAQSSSEESDLFSIFTDLFFEKAKAKAKPKPQSQPKPPPQPKPKSTPSQRQDELVKKFPGSKIIRRPNPMEEADDSTYIKFPEHDCGNYMERFYEEDN